MLRAWVEIERLIRVNARHRRGFRIAEVEPSFILDEALAELQELRDAPCDLTELSDLLGILFHYAIKQGWSIADIEAAMLEKFAIRFTEECT
jgi:hypothetical protein